MPEDKQSWQLHLFLYPGAVEGQKRVVEPWPLLAQYSTCLLFGRGYTSLVPPAFNTQGANKSCFLAQESCSWPTPVFAGTSMASLIGRGELMMHPDVFNSWPKKIMLLPKQLHKKNKNNHYLLYICKKTTVLGV